MRNDDDALVAEAVDAVAWSQDVRWDRYERLATPAGRRSLDSLRALAPIFRSSPDGAGPSTLIVPTAGTLARRAIDLLIAIAALEVVATLAALPWTWGDYHREHGDVAVYMTALLVGHSATACLLWLAGGRDRRTRLLGAFFLFKATLGPLHMLPAFLGQMPAADLLQASVWAMPGPTRVFLLLIGYPVALAAPPVFLWAFARECPRLHRRTRLDDLARRMVPLSAAIGCAMCAGLAAAYLAGAVNDAIGGAVYVTVLDAAIATTNALSLAAVVVIVLRAHTAPADELRRVVLFSAAFLMWTGLAAAYDFVEAFSPGFWLSNYRVGPVLQLIQLLRFPGMVLLWYSVLAVRIPHPREVARGFYRGLLMRRGRLRLVAAAPAVALGWLVVSAPERTVGAVLADPLAQWLFGAVGVMLALLAGRESILNRLDAWVFPETVDQRSVLAPAVARLAQAGRIAAVGQTVTRTVKHGCGAPAALLSVGSGETAGLDFRASTGRIPPLPRESAIVHILETAGGPLRVHPGDDTSVFPLLLSDETAWVRASAADVVVPVPGPGAELLGILVVGRRFDDRPIGAVDLPFIEALGAAAGLAIARLRLLETQIAGSWEPPPAQECPACGCVTGPGEPLGCGCQSAPAEAAAPSLLAGKYRLTRRLGAGGMGAVYLARDLQLERDVAVKTLTGMSVSRLMGMKPEAWAMATVTHAAVAQIHAIESWRGRPFLVVEYLARGTLADRLRRGPVPPEAAVSIAAALGDGLTALHRVGYLHGDVKPSNIGFTSSGSPKLLDFGLARQAKDGNTGGTLRYMSPEALAGGPAEEADDSWSLCVVLHEMVAGRHPFMDGDVDVVIDRIRHRRITPDARPESGSERSWAVLAFTASTLSAPRSERPATARAFTDALRRMQE